MRYLYIVYLVYRQYFPFRFMDSVAGEKGKGRPTYTNMWIFGVIYSFFSKAIYIMNYEWVSDLQALFLLIDFHGDPGLGAPSV